MDNTESILRTVCDQFVVAGDFMGYEHIKVGNVNQTYMVVFLNQGRRYRYCLQKINSYAFRNPAQLMSNVQAVTEHIHRANPEHVGIMYQHSLDGRAYVDYRDSIWRMYTYIPATTYSQAESPRIVTECGRAFGEFQMMLSDFPSETLFETIPGFHNTPRRLNTLFRDAETDPVGRVSEVREELSQIRLMAEEAGTLQRSLDAGLLPLRVTHNDTKLNNVLFEERTQTALTVIDLDTVMPGLIAYDYGDAIRFMANTEAEDSRNYRKAIVDMDIFRTFTDGFLSLLHPVLTDKEIETLSYGPFILALELAARFLDDYITGDPYFKINYPEHNLDRTRCQLNLAKDCLRRRGEMQEFIDSCCHR